MNGSSIRNLKFLAAVTVCLVTSQAALAQTLRPAVLEVDVDYYVQYFGDVGDYSKFGVNPNPTTPAPRTFQSAVILGDIVAVNGKPAKGSYVARGQIILQRNAPAPGQAIADVLRNGPVTERFEILQADGTPVGTIMTVGQTAGTPPPGAPASAVFGNFAIVGGTGAFLGARGQAELAEIVRPPRNADFTEDPANRRTNGGGLFRYLLQVIPLFQPSILTVWNRPAVFHSDTSEPVTPHNPARAGEILSLFATGLGPVHPNIDLGTPFPNSPLATVNSPVEVTVNGVSTEVLAATGYPGTIDRYQVNFRVPDVGGRETAAVQLSSAWIASSPVSIAFRE